MPSQTPARVFRLLKKKKLKEKKSQNNRSWWRKKSRPTDGFIPAPCKRELGASFFQNVIDFVFSSRTALHYACSKGNPPIVQELLEWKAKPNIGDNQQRTPLIKASSFFACLGPGRGVKFQNQEEAGVFTGCPSSCWHLQFLAVDSNFQSICLKKGTKFVSLKTMQEYMVEEVGGALQISALYKAVARLFWGLCSIRMMNN